MAVGLALCVVACGDGTIENAGGTRASSHSPSRTRQVLAANKCHGRPLKFTTIVNITGPNSRGGNLYRIGTDAALNAINGKCAVGASHRGRVL